MKRIVVALLGAIGVLAPLLTSGAVEAGGGGGGSYACQGDKDVRQVKGGVEIVMRDSCFGPAVARVPRGSSVRWVNGGQMPHNVVTLNDPSASIKMLQSNGSSVTLTLSDPGAFVYYCSMHPGMVGTVFVDVDGDGAGMQQVSASVAPSAPVEPFSASAASRADVAALTPADGSDGVPVLGVLLLALIVGTVAGGGSTWLVRKLEQH